MHRSLAGRPAIAAGLLALAACAGRPAPSAAPPLAAGPPRIAVISAFTDELERLRAATTITATRVLHGRTYVLGTLAGHEVVLLLSGYSMVNAAMTTQALLDHFPVRAIVFSGIAGGVNPGLQIGDVAVPARWGNYQEHVFARETAAGFDPGPRAGEFAGFGMMFPRSSSVLAVGTRPDSLERRFWFPADSGSLATAREVARTVRLHRCTPSGECLGHEPRVVVGGNGVSGPTFVDNAAYREYAWRTFQADALDMETAAVAMVAWHHRVPFVAFRSLSDLAGGGPGANELRTFGQLAAANSAAVVLEYLKALPAAQGPPAAR